MKPSIPNHVAFIMDGNRRWAVKHKLQLIKGHDKGAELVEKIVDHASTRGVEYITFWAFSAENWKRSKVELEMLMRVFRKFLTSSTINRMIKKGVRLLIIGDYHVFPVDIVDNINELVRKSSDNAKITVTIALNYGGRSEIIQAVNRLLIGRMGTPVDADTFATYLETTVIPDPDFLIRTGGEKRLSGFLPWQTVYTELYFTDTLWPDFDEEEFDKALEEYARRERRFGK